MQTYSRLPVAFERGEGVWLWDKQGRRYLDALSGVAVCSLGHAHPVIAGVIAEQSEKLMHTSNLYEIPMQERLAERLARLTGLQTAFFCNSGAEANETAVKLVRRHAREKGFDSPVIVTLEGAFHGRTLGMLAAGDLPGNARFAPLPEGFTQVPFGDVAALEEKVKTFPGVCAVMLEPVQGESGVRLPPPGYLKAVRDLCDAHGLWLILDEVQTGVGRTGAWFACQHEGVVPDVMTLAKALGNGMPIGACLAGGALAAAFVPGEHGSTFGGNLLACAVAGAVLDVIESNDLVANAERMGAGLLQGLRDALDDVPGVRRIRGKGLMIGVELDRACRPLAGKALARGLLINVTAEKVIRLLPPLIIGAHEVDEVVAALHGLVREFLSE